MRVLETLLRFPCNLHNLQFIFKYETSRVLDQFRPFLFGRQFVEKNYLHLFQRELETYFRQNYKFNLYPATTIKCDFEKFKTTALKPDPFSIVLPVLILLSQF